MKKRIKSKFSDESLDYLLGFWGYWYACKNNNGLGFQPKNIWQHYKECGGVLIKNRQAFEPPTYEDAEMIEEAVQELTNYKPLLGRALRQRYCEPGTLKDKAKRISVSYSHFKVLVDIARHWIMGRISG